MTDLFDRLAETAEVLHHKTGRDQHDALVVLGSGLGAYPDSLSEATAIPYEQLPGFPRPGAVGHAGTAYSVQMGANRVLLLAGRAHAYEGYAMEKVTFPVRMAVLAGCSTVVLTNAAGGCGEGIGPGDLVAITDHINMSGFSPLMGANDERLGPRFPDMTDVYTPRLRALAQDAARQVDIDLKEGVYFWWHGPMYETPAEVQMAKRLGASLVGMSTVPEATAARHMGADVLGISLCTNLAAGMAGHRLSSAEVIETAGAASTRVTKLFDKLLPSL